jgi:TRAP-type C4-dicarboxylate transport system permease large subunit
MINGLLIVLGMFIDTAGILLIAAPILAPAIVKLGIDPVHFGVVFVVNLMIGLITPPVGMALFIAANVAKRPFMVVARTTAPFLVPLIVVLLLLTYFPQISLYIPNLVFGPAKTGL